MERNHSVFLPVLLELHVETVYQLVHHYLCSPSHLIGDCCLKHKHRVQESSLDYLDEQFAILAPCQDLGFYTLGTLSSTKHLLI